MRLGCIFGSGCWTQVTPNRTGKQAQLRDNIAHDYAEVILIPITVSTHRLTHRGNAVETPWKQCGNVRGNCSGNTSLEPIRCLQNKEEY